MRAHHWTVDDVDLRGAEDADFLALGLGGTNMMAMLWTVAMGKRAVGVEMRGDPFLGVHWNIRVDLYHQLGLIDRMMLERYGEDGVPRRADGRRFRLAECFYGPNTVAGDIVADEIIDGFDTAQHIVGTIHHVEFIDDRFRDGVPNRVVTILSPPPPPPEPVPSLIRDDMVEVLDGPSTFQAGAASILVLLRRYLERIEEMDLERDGVPRVRLFTRHRVVPKEGEGFVPLADGRLRVRIEQLHELDYKGKFVRVRAPGSEVIDLGVPELFMIAQGFRSSDADRLGFVQRDVAVDHGDGRGPVVAQADFLAGLIEVLVGGRLRRRISSVLDENGDEYWVRQIAVGHENDPEVGWVLVQVPDFLVFDPVAAGLVDEDTDPESPEFYAAYQQLVYELYMDQCAEVLELPKSQLKKIQMVYGPKLFSLVERAGDDARVATNGVVGGDSFGNGHFLTSGGAMTGMVGHGARVLRYWQARDGGSSVEDAIRSLADGIKEDTDGWLEVSAKEYSDAVPINFGAERIAQIERAGGFSTTKHASAIDASRRARHSLLPLDPSDWRRLFLRNGRVHSAPLPELHAMHPALRGQRARRRGAKLPVVYVAPSLDAESLRLLRAVLGQPGVQLALVSHRPPEALPESVRVRLGAHTVVKDAFDGRALEEAARELGSVLGEKPELLLGTHERLLLPLAEARAALGIAGMSVDVARRLTDREALRAALHDAGLPLCDGSEAGEAYSLEVMTVGGVPAWFSGTRRRSAPGHRAADGAGAWLVTLPRELDDPGDARLRQMAFAALRALGVESGLTHIRWSLRDDGVPAIADVSCRPPGGQVMTLMGHAHGANLYRAWGNAVVHARFAPIPRQLAAGAAFVRGTGEGSRVAAVHGVDDVQRELASLVVEMQLPEPGTAASDSEGFVIVRHEETARVDEALERIASRVRIELTGAEPEPLLRDVEAVD